MKTKNALKNLLVIMDFSEAAYCSLKYAISIAKTMGSTIQLVHFAHANNAVENNNKDKTRKSIGKKATEVEKKLKSLVEIIETENLMANYSYVFGNVNNKIELFLKDNKPDLVLLGKKRKISILKEPVFSYFINKFSGNILVISSEIEFNKNTKMSLAFTSNTLNKYDLLKLTALNKGTSAPLQLVNIQIIKHYNQKLNAKDTWFYFNQQNCDIELGYIDAQTVSMGFIKHIATNKPDLVCLGRGKHVGFFNSLFKRTDTALMEVIKQVEVPVLVLGKK